MPRGTPLQSNDTRLSIRPGSEDFQHLEVIGEHLRVTGQVSFPTRSDAMRHALRVTAGAITTTAPTPGT